MKITIIVFSPAQNTLTTAQLLEQSFLKRNAQVQLIDFTGRKELADQASITNYLQEKVKTHDILCIGGPVYAGHLQENVKNIIKALPLPDEKWGVLVVPFVTYGGVHSSVALKEAGKMLKKRERKNIAGMKITAFHSLTKNFSFKIHESKPGDEELSIIETLTERVFETVGKEYRNKLRTGHAAFLLVYLQGKFSRTDMPALRVPETVGRAKESALARRDEYQ